MTSFFWMALRGCAFAFLPAFLPEVGVAADLSSYLIQKGIELTQTNSQVANPDSNNGYIFQALVEAAVSNVVTSAMVQPPVGISVALTEQSDHQKFSYKKKYDSLKKLNTGAPNGSFQFTINTVHDGTKNPVVPIQSDTYPRTPHLLNYDGAQSVDAGGYFLFRWEYLVDGTVPDFAQFRIEDSSGKKVFETADSGPDALNGSYTSLLLLRDTLLPNQRYQGILLLSKQVFSDSNAYPGAVGLSSYYKRLKFNFKTAPVPSVADVKIYSLLKAELYKQTGEVTPAALTNNGFLFQAQVEASASNAVTQAALVFPSGLSTNLNTSDNRRFKFEVKLDTSQQLDRTYPDGNHTFHISTKNQQLKAPALALVGDSYPPIPQFKNVGLEQAIDPKQSFSLEWEPFSGATSMDFIHLQIEDQTGTKVFESADLGKANALSGLRTFEKVKDGTLLPGSVYTAKLLFVKVTLLDSTAYPGALGAAGLARETRVDIRTTGVPPLTPKLSAIQFSPGQGFKLGINGTQGQSYRIEAASDLRNWLPVGAITLSSGQAEFTDSTSINAPHQFYRALQQ